VLGADLDDLRAEAAGCVRCRLHSGRTQAVFSDGSPEARLMVVGEAPGAHEDRTGLPFVGPAGKLLDLMLASVGLSRRESVYICNVIKCRPPGNRNPAPDEIAACSPFLTRQIELVKPEALLAVGSFSAQLLTAKELPLGKLRGSVYSYEGVPLVITYHPAALLRNPGWSRAAWDDLQLLRQVMEGG
jgi:DNA polymerase